MRPRLPALVVAALVAGCHQVGRLPPSPPIDYKAHLGGTRGTPRHSDGRDAPFEEVAQARGMPRLRDVDLPSGHREIRISDWYQMILGAEVRMLRVVETPTGATGEVLIFFHKRGRLHDYASRPHSCGPGESAVCVWLGVFPTPLRWDTVAARLDSLGAWAIRQRCEGDGMHVTDSGELMLQRLIGSEFGTYGCNAPGYRGKTPSGKKAHELYKYFGSIVNAAR